MTQNKDNQNNIIAKIKYMLTKRESANHLKDKEKEEPQLLGWLPLGVIPTMTDHPDANLED